MQQLRPDGPVVKSAAEVEGEERTSGWSTDTGDDGLAELEVRADRAPADRARPGTAGGAG
ncbi:hypothetical protein ACIGBH_24525 [Streptomyces sp. NPDC085929]|uniref:hypothetical protein n=1 Tax=Streptomyces sp. NPDC085929 TaxID=3365739 RepID=UPI0037D552FE